MRKIDCIKWFRIWKLTFLDFVQHAGRKPFAKYKCDCWAEKSIRIDAVKENSSCWCVRNKESSERQKKRMNAPENKAWVKSINRTHGMKGTSEYRIWSGIKNRTDGKYYWKGISYAKKWISMYPEWRNSFQQFYADMWPRPEWMSIDRIDNDWNYEPWNCRWATMEEQNNNTSRNVFLEYNWERKTIRQWTKSLWLNRMYFYNRRKLWHDFQTTLNSLLCPLA